MPSGVIITTGGKIAISGGKIATSKTCGISACGTILPRPLPSQLIVTTSGLTLCGCVENTGYTCNGNSIKVVNAYQINGSWTLNQGGTCGWGLASTGFFGTISRGFSPGCPTSMTMNIDNMTITVSQSANNWTISFGFHHYEAYGSFGYSVFEATVPGNIFDNPVAQNQYTQCLYSGDPTVNGEANPYQSCNYLWKGAYGGTATLAAP